MDEENTSGGRVKKHFGVLPVVAAVAVIAAVSVTVVIVTTPGNRVVPSPACPRCAGGAARDTGP